MITVPVDVLGPLQTALFNRLKADAPLLAMLGRSTRAGRVLDGVYDGAPEGALFPYVELGEAIETPRNTHGAFGAETAATLHVWSKMRGYSEGLKIADRLRVVLDHQPLTVTGHSVISVRHERTFTLRDPNPELRHLPVTFRITTEQE